MEFKSVVKRYETKTGEIIEALKGVTLNFSDRGLYFITGKSGCGKTTLLNLIGGMDSVSSGSIIFDGQNISEMKADELVSHRRKSVGFVFQDYGLIDTMTVGQNILLALELSGDKGSKDKVSEILTKVGLDGDGKSFYGRRINELSGGQKQRVAIARALVKNPRIILADEPTGNLDSVTSEEIYSLLKHLSEDTLIIIASHDKEAAEKYGDRIIEMKDGEIIGDKVKSEPQPGERSEPERTSGRSGLSVKRAFAIGLSWIKHKPIRYIFSILLASFAFALFGFSLTLSMTDIIKAEILQLYDNGLKTVIVRSENFAHAYAGSDKISQMTAFTDKQLEALSEINPEVKPMRTYSNGGIVGIYNNLYITGATQLDYMDNIYVDAAMHITYLVEVNPSTGEDDALITPDKRFIDKSICRLPSSFDEMAISDMNADMIIRYGLKNEQGEKIEINNVDDIIGKQLGRFKICGVYSTERDKSIYDVYDIKGSASAVGDYVKNIIDAEGIPRTAYVAEGFLENRRIGNWMVTIKLSGNINHDLRCLRELFYETERVTAGCRLTSPYSVFVGRASQIADIAPQFCFPLSAVFAVFSSLLLINYFMVSLAFKKRDIGVLMSLGASWRNICSICFSESGMMALASFSLAIITVVITCAIINSRFFIPLFLVNGATFFALLGISLVIAAICTIFPAIRLSAMKPVDVISDK